MQKDKRHTAVKKQAQTYHFNNRFRERTGLSCNRFVRRDILEAIHNQEVVFLGRQSSRLHWYLFKFNEREFVIVYDHNRDSLVTVLFKDADVDLEIQNLQK